MRRFRDTITGVLPYDHNSLEVNILEMWNSGDVEESGGSQKFGHKASLGFNL